MNLLVVSINHRTASVGLRENLHLSQEEIKLFLREMKKDLFSEGFIISTCNRTEVYGIPKDSKTNFHDVQKFLLERKCREGLKEEHFQNFFSCGSVNHLFKVSAGIDSQLLGDNQILGQLKDAFRMAEDAGAAGFLMKRLFDSAIKAGKRAKTETTISDGAITVSYAAVQLTEKIFSNLSKKSALVIGAGETGQIAAKHLKEKGVKNLTICNRTHSRALELAAALDCQTILFENLKEKLEKYDIIISATSAPSAILKYEDVLDAMSRRGLAPTCIMDIAMPRDIESSVREIENVFYHDIDSLKVIVDQNIRKRELEVPKVQKIIMEELTEFFTWYNSLEAGPMIKSLREHFEKIRQEEVEKQKNRLSEEDYEKLEIVTRRIVNKLLHQPMVELKKVSAEGYNDNDAAVKLDIIRNLFKLG